MYLTRLKNMDPWEWPEDAGGVFLQTVLDPDGSLEDRMLAAKLGGNPVVIKDELAQALLQVAMNADEPQELRRQAIISMEPVGNLQLGEARNEHSAEVFIRNSEKAV